MSRIDSKIWLRPVETDAALQLEAHETPHSRPRSRRGVDAFDFSQPIGAEALCAPDSVTWRVFKNPVAIFIGGITAVLLEFAEPRIRSGVWDHSIFKTDPILRLRRTGLAAMITVYGPRDRAEKVIAGITRKHERVEGKTPAGVAYRALDPELMNWVQATASYGFMNAYHSFVRPLSQHERDTYYNEASPGALLFGAPGAPQSEAAFYEMLRGLESSFESSPIVSEFLDIAGKKSILPPILKPLQRIMLRSAIDILPDNVRNTLELGPEYDLKGWERRLLKSVGSVSDKVCLKNAPPAQACVRVGLPPNYLYKN